MPTTLCIQWPRFGPYHLARIQACHEYFSGRGVEVVGLETAGGDAIYEWQQEQRATPYRREQLFPGQTFEHLDPRQVHRRMTETLDALDPAAVAIISYSYPDARACLQWCRRNRRTAVLMFESKQDDVPRSAWKEWIKARIVSCYDAALASGTPQRAYLEALGFPPDAVFTGYGAVDNAFFRAGAEEARSDPEAAADKLGLSARPPFFLASNRFIPRKNLDALVRAYARYRRHAGMPWPLVLLGDGPQRPSLEALVARGSVAGVHFAGFRQIDELPAFYGLAGAFVHPARAEEWGLVVNEAMAAGLPVLVSRTVGCARDLVHEGENGFTFAPDDVDELARLMRRISAPGGERDAMGRRSREIVEGWSPQNFARQLHRAVEAGSSRSDRGLGLLPRLLLETLQRTGREVRSFTRMPNVRPGS